MGVRVFRAGLVLFGLLIVTVSFASSVSDVWSFWRFQVKRGYYPSMITALEAFQPKTVFDQEKKSLLLGHLHELVGKKQEARTWFKKYSAEFPLLADYAAYRVLLLESQIPGNADVVLQAGQSFLKNYPHSAFALQVQYRLAIVYAEKGRCEDALALFRTLESSQWLLSTEESHENEWVRAQCALRLQLTRPALTSLKTIWVETLDDPKLEAVERLLRDKGESISERDIMARVNTLKQAARYDDALALVEKRIPPEKCHVDCLRTKASLLFSDKRYRESDTAYMRLYDRNKAAQFLYFSCRARARDQQSEAALRCYEQLISLRGLSRSLNVLAHYYRAMLLLEMDRFEASEADLKVVAAGARSKDFADRAQWLLGWLQWRMNRPEKSLPYFRRLAEKGPSGIERGQGLYWIGKSYLRMGKKDDALKAFRRLVASAPLSYYGILAENRLNELAPTSEKQRVGLRSQVTRYMTLPPQDESPDAFASMKQPRHRRLLLQARQLGAVGLTNDARHTLRWLLWDLIREKASSKTKWSTLAMLMRHLRERHVSPQVLVQLLLNVQDYYHALQVAHTQVGFDQTRPPKNAEQWAFWNVLYPKPYGTWIEPLTQRYHLNAYLLWSIMKSESLFRETIVSNAGARGLLQIMPFTGSKLAEKLGLKDFQLDQLMIPNMNILLSSRYLHDLLYKMDGNLVFTVAAYNAGPHKVRQWMEKFHTTEMDEFVERVPYPETRIYIMKNIHFLAVYTYLYHPRDPRLRVANQVHRQPHPLLNPEKENWDYELLD